MLFNKAIKQTNRNIVAICIVYIAFILALQTL